MKKSAKKTSPKSTSNRKPFPVEQVTKLWKAGKKLAEIAKAVGRYDEKASDPTASFRGVFNVLRKKGVIKVGFRTEQPATKPVKKVASKKAASKKAAKKAPAQAAVVAAAPVASLRRRR